MGRAPCCEKVGLKKGRWTAEEDRLLVDYIKANGEGGWRSLPKNAGLLRCGKSCRLRWINYLREDLKRGNISPEEEETILKLRATLGNRWSVIATHLPGRTDNEIKNYWNAHLSKRAGAGNAAATPENDAGEPVADADDDGGEVCSEDARSTVLDGEKDPAGPDDSVTSPVSPKRKRRTKGPGNVKSSRVEESSEHQNEEEEGHREKYEEKCGTAGCCRKKKRSGGEKGESCQNSSVSGKKKKKEEKVGDYAVDSEQTGERMENRVPKKRKKETEGASVVKDQVSNEPRKKKKKFHKPSTEKPTGEETVPCAEQPVHAHDVTTDTTAYPVKADPEIDASGCDGSGAVKSLAGVCGADEEKGSPTQVEDGLNASDGGLINVADCATGLDLFEAIDSDGGLLGLPDGGCLDPHGGLLLDYLDMSGTDGPCGWAGTHFAEEVDSVAGGWSVSDAVSTDTSFLGSEDITNASSGSTTSSYANLAGLCDGSPALAEEAADHGIGSLPWEAEDDMWRLLSEFVGQVEAADARDHQADQDAGAQPLQQPFQPEMMQDFLSIGGICDDNILVDDDAYDNPWVIADMFLS